MNTLYNSPERVKKDLFYLFDTIKEYLDSNFPSWNADDQEFVRIWDLYEELRISLRSVDEELFGKLRRIEKPASEPHSHFPNGFYARYHIKPIFNEVIKAINYWDLFQKSTSRNYETVTLNTSIHLITSRFTRVVRQIQNRYDKRETLEINDEYDMQDLFHSLLCLFFDDIRAEEWTPSYAGGCSRIDFLLKDEKTAIELKKTRKGLDANELGKQLIIDIDRYRVHPDVEKLICFVYDPDFRIANPKGIESDLSKIEDNFEVLVIVEPK